MPHDRQSDNVVPFARQRATPALAYSRRQALEDGLLIDVTDIARQIDLRYPTAVTQAVWNGVIALGVDETDTGSGVILAMRVLRMCRTLLAAARAAPHDSSIALFIHQNSDGADADFFELSAISTVGDNGEGVATIMLRSEA